MRAALLKLTWTSLLVVAACGAEPAAKPSAAGGEASKAASSEAQKVGYDLRTLRPRNEEKLADMFERMRKEALAEGKQVAVLFSAGWCEPCRRLELELGNMHPESSIGHVRILELKEEDWEAVTRMNEFNDLRRRWYAPLNSYPVFIVLDEDGNKIEEMKEAVERLQAEGQAEPSVAQWFESIQGDRA
jgi:thiol-disulfide isomerase/thioredoxin